MVPNFSDPCPLSWANKAPKAAKNLRHSPLPSSIFQFSHLSPVLPSRLVNPLRLLSFAPEVSGSPRRKDCEIHFVQTKESAPPSWAAASPKRVTLPTQRRSHLRATVALIIRVCVSLSRRARGHYLFMCVCGLWVRRRENREIAPSPSQDLAPPQAPLCGEKSAPGCQQRQRPASRLFRLEIYIFSSIFDPFPAIFPSHFPHWRSTMNPVENFFRRVWSWIKIRVLWLVSWISGEDSCDNDVEGWFLVNF